MRMKHKHLNKARLRTHTVSVRFNLKELQELDMLRQQRTRGAFVRDTFFVNVPAPVPEINRNAYVDLSRTANHIHLIAQNIDEDVAIDIDEMQLLLHEFRIGLLTLMDKE